MIQIYRKQRSLFSLNVNSIRAYAFIFWYMFGILDLSAQGVSAADINLLRGVAAMQGSGFGGSIGGSNFSTLMPITMSSSSTEDDAAPAIEDKAIKKPSTLRPNEFQNYVMQTTGQTLPLYGADFFENLKNSNAQFSRSPVSDDYSLGVGDQLLIRVWGSTSSELNITIDRQGYISIPKLGTLKLAGVQAGQLEAVVKAFFSKFYKDIEVSVGVGKIRKITVFVVGQANKPGSYSLTGQATLTSALFASGGPNSIGSLRNLQLIRQGKKVAQLDLYDFLGKGEKSQDVLLQDGDVLFYTKAVGYVAYIGKVNTPSVLELKNHNELLGDLLFFAGGLPVTADTRRATLDRIEAGKEQPRTIESVVLSGAGLQKLVKNGDILTIYPVLPEIANAVTLRGAVSQPSRMPWAPGMRISDLITHKGLLLSQENIREKNEALFNKFELEITARNRAKVPSQLAIERVLMEKQKLEEENLKAFQKGIINKKFEPAAVQSGVDSSKATFQEQTEREIAIAQLGKPEFNDESLVERIGQLKEQTNMDYAVIERFSRDNLQVSILPFNLGQILKLPKSIGDLFLEPGDVITVFSNKDIQVPISRNKSFVRIEGEVNNPGIYPVETNENLKTLILKAGGLTSDAYIFAAGLYREEVKKSQLRNMDKLLRKMEAESSAAVAQIAQSSGATSDSSAIQAKVLSVQQAQKQSLDRFKMLKPEGRISLNIKPALNATVAEFPAIRLENLDRIHIPPRPDFVQIFGSVNTESALVYREGQTVKDYVISAGVGGSADLRNVILVRADGSAMTNQSYFLNDVLSTVAMPGDTIVMPEKFDRESIWSLSLRNAKDFTQVLYQLGLGAAAIKTLRQ
jgi:protein involved in polysaccharide export with SLBB domain